ncbi:MAG: D-alanyl-D-alanine carboxypeptidase/D-alanyl-D-alanine-endopeptidase [Gammaproteobacteria bacterium]|nr:D-alanyl-D-alanine carboxypeptidase/D-alanyl-D-alanine-endopeptidase [Gammaproteobacteria bacterium]MDH5226037.1 D-alanyl-D-alanine carboxypeptidase/D-alanyl-D-alanine-endopeptidase [Gammaproteobacteria bacterium]
MTPILARLLPLLLLTAALLPVSGAALARDRDYLPPEVEKALKQRKVPGASLSVYVREVGRDEPLVSYNSTVLRNPASTMKVVTTFAALEQLGPAYTWRTRAYAAGPIRDQVLEGNLVLVGGGDPFMSQERWWAFAAGLRQAGIVRIAGDVVIDNSYFASQGDDRGAFDDKPYRSYNVLPDALLVNFQTVTINAVPDAATGSVRVSANPWPANLAIDNNVRLDPGACKRGAGGIVINMPEGPNGNRIALSGRYAAGCGQFAVPRAVMKAADYAYGLFRTFWQQNGGTIGGGMRLGTLPADARLLYTHESLTLAEIIRLVNKYSSNSMARALFLTMGAERFPGRPATTQAGRDAVLAFLAQRGIDGSQLVLENGSGLSRIERISAQTMADVLLAAYRSQYMPEFAASLPLSATDGTMKRRFKAPEMQGRLRMKTGTLDDVTALAGFVNAASGRTFVTVVVLNHPGAGQGVGESIQTALVEWVFGQ